MSASMTDQRIAELLRLRRNVDTELERLATVEHQQKRTRRSRGDIPDCGTEPAYQRHHHYGEPIDEACRLAHNDHNRTQSAIRRERARAGRLALVIGRAA